jgi:hypothetical protein
LYATTGVDLEADADAFTDRVVFTRSPAGRVVR